MGEFNPQALTDKELAIETIGLSEVLEVVNRPGTEWEKETRRILATVQAEIQKRKTPKPTRLGTGTAEYEFSDKNDLIT